VKKLAMVIGFSAFLLSLFFVAGVVQAKDLDRQNPLLQSALQLKRQLTSSADADQRALLAVTLAASKAGISDPAEILSAYKQAQAQDSITHLLMIDSSFIWSGTEWTKRLRTTYTYESHNLQASETMQKWDGAWIDSTKLLTSYDGIGRSLISTMQEWRDTGWQNMEKATYTYDDIEMTIEVVWQNWRNNSGWDWVDTLRTTSVLTDGLLSATTTEKWDGLQWVDVQKITYSYDANNMLTQILGQTWSGAWVNHDRTTMSYNAFDQDTVDQAQTWTGSWANSTRTQHSYDGQGDPILNVRWTWGGAAYSKTYADTLKWHSGHFVEGVRYVVATDSLDHTQYSYDVVYDLLLQEVYQYYDGGWVNVRKAGYSWQQVLVVGVDGESDQLPSSFGLSQNYPNPFNPTTVIRYSLSQRSRVNIAVFNILGQEVTTLVDETKPAGAYETTWDGTDRSGQRVSSGIYFYRVNAGDFRETRKMILLK
jgi:hypothetical protein